MKLRLHQPIAALLLLGGCLAFTACSPLGYPEFDREQSEKDVVPQHDGDPLFDPDSTRYVGDVDGDRIYLAQMSESEGVCVVIVEAGADAWQQAGCSGGRGGMRLELDSRTAIDVGNFSQARDEERTKLSESVSLVSTGTGRQ